jgi:hypothetical protein
VCCNKEAPLCAQPCKGSGLQDASSLTAPALLLLEPQQALLKF